MFFNTSQIEIISYTYLCQGTLTVILAPLLQLLRHKLAPRFLRTQIRPHPRAISSTRSDLLQSPSSAAVMSKKSKGGFYAVHKGRNAGVFRTW